MQGKPFSEVSHLLSKDTLSHLKDRREVRLWGSEPTPRNLPHWQRISSGDLALFYKEKRYVALARIAGIERNPIVSRKVWGELPNGSTWELLYVLGEVVTTDIPLSVFNQAFGYERIFIPLGFTVMDESRLEDFSRRTPGSDLKEKIIQLQTTARRDETHEPSMSSFSFTPRDFESCTGKKDDATYLRQRFQILLELLRSKLGKEFAHFTSYVAKASQRPKRGQKRVQYKNHMWLGFAHPNFVRAQSGIQLQVWIDTTDPIGIGIWIDKVATESRETAAENIKRDIQMFSQLMQSVKGHSAYLSNGYDFEKATADMTNDEIEKFVQHVADGDVYVGVLKRVSREEALALGPGIVDMIVSSFKELLPTYSLLVGEEAKGREMSYFILQTGSDEYEDHPERSYHFKASIPGSVQLANSENLSLIHI